MNKKTVMLERALDKDGRPGSFGFSVLGGHGTKYPAVVCDIESGGPAHLSRMVRYETCTFLSLSLTHTHTHTQSHSLALVHS